MIDFSTLPQEKTRIVITNPCLVCKKTTQIKADIPALSQWQNGMYVQTAFPHVSNEERELLITGIHPTCWKKLFPDEEE